MGIEIVKRHLSVAVFADIDHLQVSICKTITERVYFAI